jgi:hypothetical protein
MAYADVCSRMQEEMDERIEEIRRQHHLEGEMDVDVCWRMLTYADVC